MSDWWWHRTYTNTEAAEELAQTRHEDDADAFRKSE